MVTSRLKELWKSARNSEDYDDEYDEDVESSDTPGEEIGDEVSNNVLDGLKISLESIIPDDALSSKEMSALRLRTSKPEGYYFDDVDQAIGSAIATLKVYETSLYQRDQDVHTLATYVNNLRTDLQNQQYQLEAFQAKGQVLVDEQGNPIVIKGDARIEDVDALRRELAQAHSTIAELENSSAVANTAVSDAETLKLKEELGSYKSYVTQQQEWIENAKQHIEGLEKDLEGAALITPDAADNSEELSLLSARVHELEKTNAELEETNAQQSEWINSAQEVISNYEEQESQGDKLSSNGENEEKINELEQTIAELQGWIDEAAPAMEQMREMLLKYESETGQHPTQLSDEDQERLVALEEWSQQAVEIFAAKEEEVDALTEALQEAQEEIAKRDEYVKQVKALAEKQKEEASFKEIVEQAPEESDKDYLDEAKTEEQGISANDFKSMLAEIQKPEIPANLLPPRPKHRPRGEYPPVAPGAPLTTIPEGANIEDYL